MKGRMTKKQIIKRGCFAKLQAGRGTRNDSVILSYKNGFTLVEMLVAIVVLAVGIMAVSSVFPLSLRVSQNMKAITKGTAYAHQKLDELRTIPFNDPALGAGTHPATPESLEHRYARQYRVDDNIPITGMRRIRVRVNWIYPDTDSVVIWTYLTSN